MKRWLLGSLFALALASAPACASPCDEIADATCAAAGETSKECQEIREKAARASGDVKAACEAALELRKSLAKAR